MVDSSCSSSSHVTSTLEAVWLLPPPHSFVYDRVSHRWSNWHLCFERAALGALFGPSTLYLLLSFPLVVVPSLPLSFSHYKYVFLFASHPPWTYPRNRMWRACIWISSSRPFVVERDIHQSQGVLGPWLVKLSFALVRLTQMIFSHSVFCSKFVVLAGR